MIYILQQLFHQLGYKLADTLQIKNSEIETTLRLFTIDNGSAQVFLIADISENDLLNLKPESFSFMMDQFENSDYYERDMRKNTSLVLTVQRNNHEDQTEFERKRLEIEDDPYFFKKYILSYYTGDVDKFNSAFKNSSMVSCKEFIQAYMMDPENFTKFRNSPCNEPAYRLVCEIFIKIPPLAIPQLAAAELKPVMGYFDARSLEGMLPVLNNLVKLLEHGQYESTKIDEICKLTTLLNNMERND